ncbi:MAG: response regulator transcription factor [Acidimicrobiales bacterium]
MPAAPRVLVVEDDPTLRGVLAAVLRAEGYEVAAEGDAAGGIRAATAAAPDLVILDVRLGTGPDGLTVVRRLRADSPVPVLLLSAADRAEDVRAGFDAGADFYVTKPFAVEALIVQVEELLRRAGRPRSSTRQVGDLEVDESAHEVRRAGVSLELTSTEFGLLCALIRRPGRVLTKSQLLVEVWGYEDYNRNVVEKHVSALRRKLEAHGSRMIHTVRGTGYVVRP